MRTSRFNLLSRAVATGLTLTLAMLAGVAPAAGGTPNPALVKDIVVGGDSSPRELTAVGATLFFTAEAAGGRELWKSDGTDNGTVRVKNIFPGATGAKPRALTNFGGVLYFSAEDGSHGRELWKSDGTAIGTTMVKDIRPHGSSDPGSFLAFGSSLYFAANDGANGRELWRTDGTTAGTKRVKDVRVGVKGSNPTELTKVGNRFFFVAHMGSGNGQLWKSDGTGPGTLLVKIVGTLGSLTKAGSRLFFAGPGFPGPELWTSNGTTAGTRHIGEVRCGPEGCNTAAYGGLAYFSGFSDVGLELLRSNGTVTGTKLVKDISQGQDPPGEEKDSWPEAFIVLGGRLMFYATTSDQGHYNLWKTNGTKAGTKFVAGIGPWEEPAERVVVGSKLFLAAYDHVTIEAGLWSSDGTTATTDLIRNFVGLGELTRVGSTLYFFAHDGTSAHGRELWKYVP